MENCYELLAEGQSLWEENEYLAALNAFDRARQSAIAIGEESVAFEAGVMAADSLVMLNRYRDALGRLLELLGHIPRSADPRAIWRANHHRFAVQFESRPDIRRLNEIAADLDRIEAGLPVPKAEPHWRRGEISLASGRFADALPHYEKAWHFDDGRGRTRSAFSARAAEMAIALSDMQLAKAWRKRIDHPSLGKHVDTFIALYEQDFALLEELNAYGCGCAHMQARVHLLQRHTSQDGIHDPGEHSHRARKLLDPSRTENVHRRYATLLATVDYRLDCLRFTAGLSAVDDLYYQQPDVIPAKLKLSDKAKFDQQLRSFRFTWHLLRRHARRLDALLECDWRTKEAASRWDRAQAIAIACNANLTPHS